MENEYALYGIGPLDTERWTEQLLATDSQSNGTKRLERIKFLAARDGFHSFRIALIDLSGPPNFAATITPTEPSK